MAIQELLSTAMVRLLETTTCRPWRRWAERWVDGTDRTKRGALAMRKHAAALLPCEWWCVSSAVALAELEEDVQALVRIVGGAGGRGGNG